MGRKSRNTTGGHLPLTHYERTKKFASSEYGTVVKRVSGDAQYQLGDCALSLSSLKPTTTTKKDTATTTSTALCTASGYLYSKDAILSYLLEQTKELKEQRAAWERQQHAKADTQAQKADRKRKADFEASQKLLKPTAKRARPHEQAKEDLKRTSYWLADSQPDKVESVLEEPPARPASPHSQQPLRRKELWPIELQWSLSADNKNDATLVCSVSEKALHAQAVVAYWTSNSDKDHHPGKLVLKTVYDQMVAPDGVCPQTGRKIKQTRELQRGGSSFAGGGQAVEVQKYRPTIT